MSEPFRRVVTGHKEGKSTVLIDDKLELSQGFAANAVTIWQNHQYPAELADHDAGEGGIKIYTKGSLIRVVDFPAHSQGHNHRTKSLDYGIVIDGEIELVLEDGSKTVIRAGEVVVQQAVSMS
jgi:quercetin dioxygenase-like cupin family protein